MTCNVTCTIPLRTISASARIVRSSLVSSSLQFAEISFVVNVDLHLNLPVKESHVIVMTHVSSLRHTLHGIGSSFCSHRAHSGTDPGNVTMSPSRDVFAFTQKELWILWHFSGINTLCERG